MTGPARSADVVVVGAGPAGLAAAWRLAVAGHAVRVVERAAVVGGMAASFDIDGVTVDYGSHRLHPSIDPVILTALRGLLGDDLQERRRHGRIRFGRRWLAFPLQPADMARQLPRRFAARAAADAVVAPLRRRTDAGSFVEDVRSRLGAAVADGFYVPITRKIWGVDPSELDAELARRRIGTRSSAQALRRALARRSTSAGTFLYPRRGFGEISDAIADAAVAAGAEIDLSSTVERIALSDDGARLRLADGSAVEASMVWSTAPVATLPAMVGPSMPKEVARAATQLEHRALVLAYLTLDVARYTAFDAHYFPNAGNPLSRLSEPKNYRDGGGLDPAERTVLCAEIPCTVGDSTWSATDGDIELLVRDALVGDGLADPRSVSVSVRRLPKVYPLYRDDVARARQALDAWISAQPALVTFGRQGLFVPDNTHHALAMGWTAAACFAGAGRFDRVRWARAIESFATHVVED